MAIPYKRWWLLGLVLVLLLLVGGWYGIQAFRASFVGLHMYGVLGEDTVFWSEGDTSVMFHWPKSEGPYRAISKRPLWMVVALYAKGMHSSGLNSQSHSDGRGGFDAEEKTTVTFSSGETYVLRHAFSSQDPAERFTAGENSYAPDDGRLFLLDMTGDKPHIVQVNADLGAALGQWSGSSTDPRPMLKEGLAKLRSQHPEVDQFMNQIKSPIFAK